MTPFLKTGHRFGSVFLHAVSGKYIAGRRVTTIYRLSAGEALKLSDELARLAERAAKFANRQTRLKVRR